MNRTDKELRQIALDAVEGRIFGSWNIREHDENLISMIFMPLIFMSQEEIDKLKKADIVHFYEEYSKSSPRGVNGYPIFFSFHCIDARQWKIVLEHIDTLIKQKKEFLEE